MKEDVLNSSIRKFLKEVGVTSQREIEKAVRAAIESGKLKGNETLPISMVLKSGPVNLTHQVDGEIKLD
jgi:ribosomal protein L1